MKPLLQALLMITLLVGSSSNASSITAAKAAGSFSTVASASSQLQTSAPVFLPVQQAFQVTAKIENQRLSLNWTIADGYYLYRKGFKINSSDNSTQLGVPNFADGILKWDEYFEAEVIVYYAQTRFEVPFTSDNPQFKLQLESQLRF